MADMRDQYGKPILQTGDFGNREANGTGPGLTNTGVSSQGQTQLHRTRSSNIPEDDGTGGSRKKGLKDKVKEKVPGLHKNSPDRVGFGTTNTPPDPTPPNEYAPPAPPEHGAATPAGHTQPHDKKSVKETIKEKLPGVH